jgi:hypothetical protein
MSSYDRSNLFAKLRFSAKFFLILLLIPILFSCSETLQVTRVSPDKTIDLTGEWNQSDSSRVAEKMISSCLKSNWINNYMQENNNKPTVIVGLFRNKSSMHIPEEMFTKDIERELINSGKVNFVAMAEERKALREERKNQEVYATTESAAAMAQEKGADFMLQGVFHATRQRWKGERVVSYKVDMELINIQSTQKVWIGSKTIKKRISQSRYSW